jgi:hypothetical protein
MVKAVFENPRRPSREPFHGRHHRRRHRHLAAVRPGLRPRGAGCQALRVLRPRRRRHRRRQQELDQDHRRADRQLCPGLLRLRLEEVGLDDDLAPALRPAADPRPLPHPPGGLRRLQPVQLPVGRTDVLGYAAPGRHVFLLNSPYGPEETWGKLPREWQEELIAKKLRLFVIDATQVAQASGMGRRTNTVLQTCFFASPASCRRTRRSQHQEGDQQDLRQEGRADREDELRRGGRRARPGCMRGQNPGRCPTPGSRHRPADLRRAPPISSSEVTPGCWPSRAT